MGRCPYASSPTTDDRLAQNRSPFGTWPDGIYHALVLIDGQHLGTLSLCPSIKFRRDPRFSTCDKSCARTRVAAYVSENQQTRQVLCRRGANCVHFRQGNTKA